ncbi:MAG: ATP-binding protein [Treponema sp.]|nr:ATP-binding protein [Treponema sp.]
MKKISRAALQHNFRELIFVFLAFTVLVVAANISIGRILRGRLSDRTEEIMYTADANVRAGLSSAETILLNSYHVVIDMLERDASKQEILDYLSATTEWMQQHDQGMLGFYSIYGFIQGEFYDSIGMDPGSEYVPQMRPWYQLAIRSGDSVAYTAPYVDEHTGDLILSAVRSINVNNVMVGVLSVDINISWLVEYVSSLSPAAGGYGILLSENLTFMTHPNSDLMGRMLQVLGDSYNEIARILHSGGYVSARRIEDSNGSSAIAFFNPISNGWYIGLIIPFYQFYRDLYVTALILIVLGLVLSLTLSYILLRLSAEKIQADEDSKSKSSFLASMSHEIRTPMNAITGMAELALREGMSDTVREYVLTIKQAGANLLSIINDILDFSKVEAGLLEIIPVNYTLSSLVNDVVNIIRTRIAEKPIEFRTEIDSSIPNSLIGDEVRLRQILLNLLSNAVKYTEKGHISLSITAENPGIEQILLKIAVADTGYGIKPEDQAKLFGEFIQLDSAKNRGIEGTGLGLSITKRLCVAMGGNIKMDSEYGAGSTFTVIIPQGIATAFNSNKDNEARADNPRNRGAVSFTVPRCQFLVVDDTAINIKVAEGLLAPYQARVDTCLNGKEAIEMVKRRIMHGENYDIIFMDHMMPGMDGIETTLAIRNWEQKQTPLVPDPRSPITIIALTANAVLGMREMFLEKGFNDFLAKPIDVSKLDEILDRWIPEKDKIKGKIENEKEKNVVNAELLKVFREDAQSAVVYLRKTTINGKNTESDIKLFTITVHGMKSALANIGEHEKSRAASALEHAGLNGDTEFIAANTESFIVSLEKLILDLSPAETVNDDDTLQEDTMFLVGQLHIIKSACEDYDDEAAYAALDRLNEKSWKKETSAALGELRNLLFLHSDFDGAAEQALELINTAVLFDYK